MSKIPRIASCSCNGYEISELVSDRGQLQNLELGGAVYPTVSLTNHSCVPNTMRHNDGAICILRASATIAKGEEVTDNYGHFFQVSESLTIQPAGKLIMILILILILSQIKPRDERRKDLKLQYFFGYFFLFTSSRG